MIMITDKGLPVYPVSEYTMQKLYFRYKAC